MPRDREGPPKADTQTRTCTECPATCKLQKNELLLPNGVLQRVNGDVAAAVNLYCPSSLVSISLVTLLYEQHVHGKLGRSI